jgi:hypothetical protein
LKKVHCLYNKSFVVIDESLVKKLEITQDNTWFEQQATENGILLKICKMKQKQGGG